MRIEFHRIVAVLLFVVFGSLSAYGFDHMNRSKQRKLREVQRVERQLQRLPREHSFDVKRLSLMCKLSQAYARLNEKAISKSLQAAVIKTFQHLQATRPTALAAQIDACL